MNNLLFILLDAQMVWGRIVGALIGVPFVFLLLCYLIFARFDIFFTFCKENRIKYRMTANGQKWAKSIVFSSSKYYVDKLTYDILPLTDRVPKSRILKPGRSFFGMYWVGIPPFRSIYRYHMIWFEWVWNQLTKNYELNQRDEMTPYLFVKRTGYALYLPEAENNQGFPVNVKFVVFLRAVNARKPIFDNDDTIGQIIKLLLGDAAIYVKANSFANMYSQKAANLEDNVQEHDEFSKFLCKINEKISGETGGGIIEKFGYLIEGAKILDVEVAGDKKAEINDAIALAAIALENKKATITNAEAQKEAMDLITLAKKARYQIFENNPAATAIEVAEQKFHGNVTTYVEGNSNVTPTIPVK